MGFIEDIEALELSDEQKDALRRAHEQEISPLQADLEARRAREKKETVEQDVSMLADVIGEKNVGVLKFYRQVLLSDDEEPGLVLLSDDELELSDDQRTGTTGRREVTTAGMLREFVGLLKQAAGTSGQINLSDGLSDGNGNDRPPVTDAPTGEQATAERKERIAKVTGLPTVTRTRKRYTTTIPGGGAA